MNPKLMKILSTFIFLFSILFFKFIVYADTTIKPKYAMPTHPNLVSEALFYYKNNGKLFNDLNNETFALFLQKLMDGSENEDHVDFEIFGKSSVVDPRNRYFRHYYDYMNRNNNGGGLWWVFTSAKIWAFAKEEQKGLPSGSHTWIDARDKYNNAGDDNIKKGDAFKDLGHILHLIADMTVPSHTRNDGHGTDEVAYAEAQKLMHPIYYKFIPYAYESWCKIYGDAYIKNGPQLIGTDPLKNPITGQSGLVPYFDYLSKYTQTYYFSEDTVPCKLLEGSPQTCSDYYTRDYNSNPVITNRGEESYNGDTYVFYYGVDPDDPNKKIHLAYRSIMTFLGEQVAPEGPYSLRHPVVNYDYWIRLSKKAMQAMAGVVDLFVTLVDNTPPDIPVNLDAVVGLSTMDLGWSPSKDDLSGVAGYTIYRGDSYVATVSNNYFKDTGLEKSTEYCYTISAIDGAGNVSDNSSKLCRTTLSSDLVNAYIIGSVMYNDAQLGFVGLPLVTINLSGTVTNSTTTDGTGKYRILAPNIGNYAVTPSKEGYLFSPPNIEVQVTETKDYLLQNFVANEDRPQVTSTNPANNANNVSVVSTVKATFNKSMDASTINASTFTLQSGSVLVAGTVGYNESTKTGTFTPSANLLYEATYTATITKDVKDLDGIMMAADNSWIFTTQSQTPVIPPAPQNLVANGRDGQVSLTWNPVSGATTYNIYWGTSPGVTANKIPGITTNSYVHTSLTNGDTYYYVVKAENSLGEGSPSSEVSATPGFIQATWGVESGTAIGEDVALDSQGNIYVVGGLYAPNPDAGAGDIFILKYDSHGNFLWSKAWGTTGQEAGPKLAIDKNNDHLYIAVQMSPVPGGGVGIVLMKLDKDGNPLWPTPKKIGNIYETLSDLKIDSSSHIYVAGQIADYMKGLIGGFVLKLDSNGNKLWEKTPSGNGAPPRIALAGTSVYLASLMDLPGGGGGFAIIKLDDQGNWIWTKILSLSAFFEPIAAGADAGGNLIVAGYGYDNPELPPSYGALLKIAPSGDFLWEKRWTTTGDVSGPVVGGIDSLKLAIDQGGNIYVGGSAKDVSSASTNDRDAWLLKVDPGGNPISEKLWGGDSEQYYSYEGGYGITVSPSGSAFLVGSVTCPPFNSKTITHSFIDVQGSTSDSSLQVVDGTLVIQDFLQGTFFAPTTGQSCNFIQSFLIKYN